MVVFVFVFFTFPFAFEVVFGALFVFCFGFGCVLAGCVSLLSMGHVGSWWLWM